MNALIYDNIDQGVHDKKKLKLLEKKNKKKITWVFFISEYSKF